MQLLEDLYTAYYDARRHKRNTINQLKFELNLENNLLHLYHQLKERTYKVGRSVAFIIEKPVKREVLAASFADRVVHHLYFNYVNVIFEKTFIADSYSCRKGKGTLYGINRLEHHIRSCSHNYTRESYVLKLDLSGYFMSINRQVLYDKVTSTLLKFAHRKNSTGKQYTHALNYDLLMYLSREIIFHNPIADCYVKGEMNEWEGLPPDKSLFHSAPGCGLPIGNLTSQLFSNIYLSDFDQYMKRELALKHYGRYVDDFFIVHHSKPFLCKLIEHLKQYLLLHLGVKLHPRKIYLQNVHRGVVFLGAVIKNHRRYVFKRTANNLKATLIRHKASSAVDSRLLMQTVNSYLGVLKHHKTFALRKAIIKNNRWIFDYGWIRSDYAKFRVDGHPIPQQCS